MKNFVLYNNSTNKYYNFVTKGWTTCLTYACLITDEKILNKLLAEPHNIVKSIVVEYTNDDFVDKILEGT